MDRNIYIWSQGFKILHGGDLFILRYFVSFGLIWVRTHLMRRHVTDGETVSVEPSAGGSVFSGTEEIPECAFTLPPRWSMRYWKCRLCRGPSSAIRCPVRPATDPSCVSLHILEMDEKIGTVVPRDAVTPEARFFLPSYYPPNRHFFPPPPCFFTSPLSELF